MSDLSAAKQLLKQGNYTCVLCKGEQILTETARGVAPLLRLLESGCELHGFSAADKVVGKGAAFLYVLLGVSEVYADVISESALAVLRAAGIGVQHGMLVPYIKNRKGDGRCPIEQAVLSLDTASEALAVIHKTLRALQA